MGSGCAPALADDHGVALLDADAADDARLQGLERLDVAQGDDPAARRDDDVDLDGGLRQQAGDRVRRLRGDARRFRSRPRRGRRRRGPP